MCRFRHRPRKLAKPSPPAAPTAPAHSAASAMEATTFMSVDELEEGQKASRAQTKDEKPAARDLMAAATVGADHNPCSKHGPSSGMMARFTSGRRAQSGFAPPAGERVPPEGKALPLPCASTPNSAFALCFHSYQCLCLVLPL